MKGGWNYRLSPVPVTTWGNCPFSARSRRAGGARKNKEKMNRESARPPSLPPSLPFLLPPSLPLPFPLSLSSFSSSSSLLSMLSTLKDRMTDAMDAVQSDRNRTKPPGNKGPFGVDRHPSGQDIMCSTSRTQHGGYAVHVEAKGALCHPKPTLRSD